MQCCRQPRHLPAIVEQRPSMLKSCSSCITQQGIPGSWTCCTAALGSLIGSWGKVLGKHLADSISTSDVSWNSRQPV